MAIKVRYVLIFLAVLVALSTAVYLVYVNGESGKESSGGCTLFDTKSHGKVVCPDGTSTAYQADADGLDKMCPDKETCDVCIATTAVTPDAWSNPGFTCGGTKYSYPMTIGTDGIPTDNYYAPKCGTGTSITQCMGAGSLNSKEDPSKVYNIYSPMLDKCTDNLDAYADGNPQPKACCGNNGVNCPQIK